MTYSSNYSYMLDFFCGSDNNLYMFRKFSNIDVPGDFKSFPLWMIATQTYNHEPRDIGRVYI